MKKLFSILIISVFAGNCLIHAQGTSSLTSEQKSWLSKANRHEKNGWIYLHIEGSPEERGFQHGYLLAKEIKGAIWRTAEVWHYQTAMTWQWMVEQSVKMFIPKIDDENMAEMKGIAEGARAAGENVSLDEIVTFNASTDFTEYWWPNVKDSLSSDSPAPKKESCSSFIATGKMTADGRIVLGHNTMSSFYYPNCNVIMDILPEKGNRILMQSTAGLIHSETDFFITGAGLVGSETTIGGFWPFDPKEVPEFARMRHATQYASSIDEWCDMMKKGNNGGYANAWLIGDIKTNEIARLELGLKYIGFERKTDGYFTGSNVAEDLNILRFETKSSEQDIRISSVARRVRWKQLMKENAGKINVSVGEAMEADHYDTYLNTKTPGLRTLCSHPDLDADPFGVDIPYSPWGTIDGKVVDATMAGQMSFVARWGSACGTPFSASEYLEKHPQFEWLKDLITDRPTQPWTVFKAGEQK